MPKKRVKTSTLWVFALMLLMSTIAMAQAGDVEPKPILNSWGITAPFLTSWLPIWIFCVLGGICWYYQKQLSTLLTNTWLVSSMF